MCSAAENIEIKSTPKTRPGMLIFRLASEFLMFIVLHLFSEAKYTSPYSVVQFEFIGVADTVPKYTSVWKCIAKCINSISTVYETL